MIAFLIVVLCASILYAAFAAGRLVEAGGRRRVRTYKAYINGKKMDNIIYAINEDAALNIARLHHDNPYSVVVEEVNSIYAS